MFKAKAFFFSAQQTDGKHKTIMEKQDIFVIQMNLIHFQYENRPKKRRKQELFHSKFPSNQGNRTQFNTIKYCYRPYKV